MGQITVHDDEVEVDELFVVIVMLQFNEHILWLQVQVDVDDRLKMVVADVTEVYLHLTEISHEVVVDEDEQQTDLDDHLDAHNSINDEAELVGHDDEVEEVVEIEVIELAQITEHDELEVYELYHLYYELNDVLHDDEVEVDAVHDELEAIDDEIDENIEIVPVQRPLVEADDDE